ncbi:MAG: type II toxin-antitoxin system prevent-host-death family antitoxin [Alkalispirochaeta sp.]|jgi:prevent-host-death family protein
MKRIPKSVFKPRAFEFLRQVEERGEALVITDHGREAVRIEPVLPNDTSAAGSLTGTIVAYDAPEEPAGTDDWDVLG